ncbi:delta subunit of the central stalk of mitochondrial F1F0 ATP synthase, atp16 [Hypoxylon texense]
MGDHTRRGHMGAERQTKPLITKGVIDNATQSKTPIPRGRVVSPPLWLKAPSKEAGDARSRLRHVNAQNAGSSSNLRVTEKRGKSPRGLTRRSIRESIEKLGLSSNALLRISAPSPPTAWHVTQHQRPESWMGDSSEHAHSRTSHKEFAEPVGGPPVSPYEELLVRNQQPPSRHERPPTHLHGEDIRYSRNAFLNPSSARSAVLYSRQSVEQPNRVYRSAQAQHHNKTSHHEVRSSNYQISTHTIRDYNQSPSSTLTRFSCSPLQPRRILPDVDQGATSERGTSVPAAESRESASVLDEASDYEIHRPSPIAPPNHDCGWKDRYLALTAEIRLLKAELSTRPSLRGTDVDYTGQGQEQGLERPVTEDEDLGIQGVTIIMHLRGRDDLIINTDLTREL